jgi:hypothetical protein
MWLGRQGVWQLHVLCKIPGQLVLSLYMLTWICLKIVHIENYMLLIIFEHMHITSSSKEQSSYHLSSENVRKGYNVLSCEFLINIHGAVQMPLNMQDTGITVHSGFRSILSFWFSVFSTSLQLLLGYMT